MDAPQSLRKVKAVKFNLNDILGYRRALAREPGHLLATLRCNAKRWQPL